MPTNLASLGVGGSNAAASLLSDTFTDADSTALTSHTMNVGSGWTAHNGTWAISSNKADQTATGGAFYAASADAAQADVTITCDVTTPANNYYVGITARVLNNSNLWGLVLSRDGLGTPVVLLQERNAGANTTRASATLDSSYTNATTAMKIVTSGNTITGYLNGVQKVQYTSATFQNTATKHGLTQLRDGGSYNGGQYDNFLVIL